MQLKDLVINYAKYAVIFILLLVGMIKYINYDKYSISKGSEIVVAADVWMPFTGEANSHSEGYMIDVCKDILSLEGLKTKYISNSWDTCLSGIKDGSYDIIVGISEAEAISNNLIFSEYNYANIVGIIVQNANDPWKYTGVDSLLQKKFGVIAGYMYGDVINEYIDSNRTNSSLIKVYTTNEPTLALFDGMLNKEIDAFIEEKLVYNFAIAEHVKYSNKFVIAAYLHNKQKALLGYQDTPRGRKLKNMIDMKYKEIIDDDKLVKYIGKYIDPATLKINH